MRFVELGEALKNLVRADGYKGLWRGVLPTLLRDVPFSAIYWMSYESIKSYMGCDHPSFRQSFIAGAISGSVRTIVNLQNPPWTFNVFTDSCDNYSSLRCGENPSANRIWFRFF